MGEDMYIYHHDAYR